MRNTGSRAREEHAPEPEAQKAGLKLASRKRHYFGFSGEAGVDAAAQAGSRQSGKLRLPRPRGTPPRAGSRKGWKKTKARKRHHFGFSGERGVEPSDGREPSVRESHAAISTVYRRLGPLRRLGDWVQHRLSAPVQVSPGAGGRIHPCSPAQDQPCKGALPPS